MSLSITSLSFCHCSSQHLWYRCSRLGSSNVLSFTFMMKTQVLSIDNEGVLKSSAKKTKKFWRDLLLSFMTTHTHNILGAWGRLNTSRTTMSHWTTLTSIGVLDQRTYNVPTASEVAIVWIEGSKLLSSRIMLSCMGNIEVDTSSDHIMDAKMLFHTLYSSLGVSLGGIWTFQKRY